MKARDGLVVFMVGGLDARGRSRLCAYWASIAARAYATGVRSAV